MRPQSVPGNCFCRRSIALSQVSCSEVWLHAPDAVVLCWGAQCRFDICVLSERPISRNEVIVNARVIGGLHMLDKGEADDKIIAVLANDAYWKDVQDIADLPPVVIERLRHYFATYKLIPCAPPQSTVERVYGKEHAFAVITAAMQAFVEGFGG